MCGQEREHQGRHQKDNGNMEDILEERYAGLERCGVLYFGLNGLEELREAYGTAVAEEVYAKAEEGIRSLQSDTVHVYACGRNSFLVVGLNSTKEQLRGLASQWIENRKEMPRHLLKGGGIPSLGMAWGSAPVSLKSLMVRAAEEMLYNAKLMEEGVPLEYCIHGEITTSFGLLTKKQFFKEVGYKLKNSSGAYLVVAIDIEHFKLFNKWFGRNAGDELLTSFAEILRTFEAEHGGIAAYFGGDDFALFLPDEQEKLALLEKLLVRVTMEKAKTAGFLPAFGVYRVDNPETDVLDMYDYAVEALMTVIGHYEQRIAYYEKDMTSQAEKEIDIIGACREALKNEEFSIYLQPQVRIGHQVKIVGAEALVRWISPEKGMISPADFVPVLEKNGFIGEVDQYVWDLACRTIRSWLDKGITPVPISINISRVDIMSFDVVGYLNGLIEKYQIARKYIKVEITESAYVDNVDKILAAIKNLREYGYLLMMDDFGSGYSSLNMLRETFVDVIKLDMRFLDMSDDNIQKGISILKSVIDMSNEIKSAIVMEGVENKRQEEMLQDMGVRFAQGYLYYRPMPLAQFEELIADPENVDSRGIYNREEDIRYRNEAIERMIKNRNARYEKIGIAKTRGGFLEYESKGAQRLLNVSQSIAYMFGCDTVEEFRDYVGNSFLGMVHPKDRERIEYEIHHQISSSEWKMDYIEYRILRKDGKVRYVYDYGHLEEGMEEGSSRFYVFLLDVTDRIE